jgi:flagellar operon protein
MSDPRIQAAGAVGPAAAPDAARAVRPAGGPARPGEFDRLLRANLDPAASEPLRWSAHARSRLVQRGIQVTPEVVQRLDGAVARAQAKGSRESLVLVDQMAFVVSVRNRTVITAVDQAGMKDHVFTNIDSAVLS